MEIHFRFAGDGDRKQLKAHAKRRAQFALDRVSGLVRSMTVVWTDENGPRGGRDQRCTIHVSLRRGGRPIVVRALAESAEAATSEAINRARRRLERRQPRRAATG
ncbi:MAG: HPF/RaiA family ribosome-associated protein [Sandaracinaceae bacterium]